MSERFIRQETQWPNFTWVAEDVPVCDVCGEKLKPQCSSKVRGMVVIALLIGMFLGVIMGYIAR